ncbi:DUF6198 family protein [Mycoplasmatota bacterium zrk1]
MRKLYYLTISIMFNALGTTLMVKTDLGLTAWGSSAYSVANYFDIKIGTAFIILSVVFYIVACMIMKEFQGVNAILSFAFAFSFGLFVNIFVDIFSGLSISSFPLRIIINLLGLYILLFGVAIHLKIKIALHPMDVYLYALQKKLKNITLGTYIAYFTAFIIVVLFGALKGEIVGVGIGTLCTLLLSGIILNLNDRIVSKRII